MSENGTWDWLNISSHPLVGAFLDQLDFCQVRRSTTLNLKAALGASGPNCACSDTPGHSTVYNRFDDSHFNPFQFHTFSSGIKGKFAIDLWEDDHPGGELDRRARWQLRRQREGRRDVQQAERWPGLKGVPEVLVHHGGGGGLGAFLLEELDMRHALPHQPSGAQLGSTPVQKDRISARRSATEAAELAIGRDVIFPNRAAAIIRKM